MAAPKVIDPIYKKYASRVIKYVASGEFYDYFMDSVRGGKNTFQFSNRKVEKQVDAKWVVAVENVIKPMEEIINKPRNFIQRDEIIVNVALAKQVTPDAVRHLATHGSMVDEVTENSVRPNRLMQQTKEDSWNTYENKFVYTLLEMTWDFVDKRYEAIFAAIGEEYGAHLIMSSDSHSYLEHVTANIDIRVQQEEDVLSADKKNESIFARIARIHRILNTFRQSTFAKTMKKFGKIKPPLVRTNAIAKNPNYKACHKLWDFILTYKDVGYKIDIFDQSPEIDPAFETDIYNSIFFNYIILKNNLEQRQDRLLDTTRNFRKKELKPKYVKEIVEEIVKNYDIPDVEIRKVLIEELTKAQLMQEEEKERLRLVAEKEKEMEAKRKQEEKLRKLKEKEEQKERLRQEKLAEKEALRQEKLRQKEEARLAKEKEKQDAFDQVRMGEIRAALDAAKEFRAEVLKKRAEEESADQIKAAQAEERRRIAEEKKAAREKEKEKERIAAEKNAEKEKARIEAQREKEAAKLAAMKEREKARLAEEKQRKREEAAAALKAEKAREKAAEKKAAEKERLAEKKEAEKAKAKAKAAAEREKAKAKAAAEKEKAKAKAAAEKEKAKEKIAAEKTKAATAAKTSAATAAKTSAATAAKTTRPKTGTAASEPAANDSATGKPAANKPATGKPAGNSASDKAKNTPAPEPSAVKPIEKSSAKPSDKPVVSEPLPSDRNTEKPELVPQIMDPQNEQQHLGPQNAQQPLGPQNTQPPLDSQHGVDEPASVSCAATDDDDDIRDLLEAVGDTTQDKNTAEEPKPAESIHAEREAEAVGDKPHASFYSFPMQTSSDPDVAGEKTAAQTVHPDDRKKSKGIKGFLRNILNGSH